MDKKDFTNLGEQIKNTVQEAVESMDFSKLNQEINESVKSALNEVKTEWNKAKQGFQNSNSYPKKKDNEYTYTAKKNQQTFDNSYQENKQKESPSNSYQGGAVQYQYKERTTPSAFQYTYPPNKANIVPKYSPYQEQAAVKQQANRPKFYADEIEQRKLQYQKNSTPKVAPNLITKKPYGRISGTVLSIFGYLGTALFGITIMILSILALTVDFSVFTAINLGLLPFLGISIFMAVRGNNLRNRVKRFRQYSLRLQNQMYCTLKELAFSVNKTEKFVEKDLRKMILLGMFPQGHIDDEHICFMLNNEVYQQYIQAKTKEEQLRAARVQREEAERERASEMEANPDLAELEKTIQEGQEYIRQIQLANQAIQGQEVSKKLAKLEQIIDKIFVYVKEHPEQLTEIRKFMEYYLPTTLKLVNTYKDFNSQIIAGDNIITAKREIEKTLDTINEAFENLLDGFYQDAAMEVSADISVLETLLAQEGLAKKDF